MNDLDCKHEWGPVSLMYGTTDLETKKCSKCGLVVFRQLPLFIPVPGQEVRGGDEDRQRQL